MSGDELNVKIAKFAAAYNKLEDEERTEDNVLKLFNMFNTNNNGTSKDKLTDVDQIDDFFKDIMGLTVRSISKEEFCRKINTWAPKFAKYKTPENKKGTTKTPLAAVSNAKASGLARELVKHIQPSAGNNWWGDVWGDDDDRAQDSFAMFGIGTDKNGQKPQDIIDEKNIVEVFDKINLAEFRKSCNMLDDKDETAMVAHVVACFRDRVDLLQKEGIKVPDDVIKALDDVDTSVGNHSTNFNTNISAVIKGLRGLGVAK